MFRRIWNKRNQRVSAERLAGRLIAVVVVTSAVKRGVNLLKTRDQTRHRSVEMLRVYCRDVELFNGNAAAGLL